VQVKAASLASNDYVVDSTALPQEAKAASEPSWAIKFSQQFRLIRMVTTQSTGSLDEIRKAASRDLFQEKALLYVENVSSSFFRQRAGLLSGKRSAWPGD
jgi:hypothetical protein